MIPVLTKDEMKKIDNSAKNGDINIGMQYMQKASRGIFDLIISENLNLQKQGVQSRTVILAGSGNNGGDGILLASHLLEEGYPCVCFILCQKTKIKNEARKALEALAKTKPDACFFIDNPDKLYLIQEHLNFIASSNTHCFIIDSIFGIGFTGTPDDTTSGTIKIIQQFKGPNTVIAVDSPSGVDNDSGEFTQAPIKANYTLSMGFPKLGSFFYPGRAYYGITAIHTLSYPEKSFTENFINNIYFTNSIKEFFPPRQINGSKYDHGTALIIAGDKSMQGAAVLSSKAALRTGLGLLYTLSSSAQIINNSLPEAIAIDFEESNRKNLKVIEKLSPKLSAIGIGPGLGRSYDALIHKLVKETKLPLILDADAINAFENKHTLLKSHQQELLITPHEGEYLRLFPGDFTKQSKPLEKINALKKRAQEFQINILLKGTPNILVDIQGRAFIIPYGNSALATAGTGDVLTGMITGFAAQIYLRKMPNDKVSKLVQAALLACYLHGKAGEKASMDHTEYCVIASDILDYLPRVIKESV